MCVCVDLCVCVCVNLLLGAAITRVGSRTSATVAPSRNKAERAAIAEGLQSKVAGMNKPVVGAETKPAKNPKPKKDCSLKLSLPRVIPMQD